MTHVCIVMASHNGARHLPEQLASFLWQDHTDWSLLVSDDASTDDTPELVRAFAESHPSRTVRLRSGPCRGNAASNFLSALSHPDLPPDSALALSDQDDIWMQHRLSRALELLAPQDGPAVYASRTILCTEEGKSMRPSRRHRRGPSFGNALVQNILPGNTIVLNPAAATLVRRTIGPALAIRGGHGVAHHDWWLYALATGAGAHVISDDRPGLYYRQHSSNLMGAHRGLRKSADRLTMIRDGRFQDWLWRNLVALDSIRSELTPEALALLIRFQDWMAGEEGNLRALRRAGIRRQTRTGDALFALMSWRKLLHLPMVQTSDRSGA